MRSVVKGDVVILFFLVLLVVGCSGIPRTIDGKVSYIQKKPTIFAGACSKKKATSGWRGLAE